MPDFGVKFAFEDDNESETVKTAYRPRWQDTPGYKTFVDMDSEKGIFPAQTENTKLDPGQDRQDATWPVQPSQSREKERAIPIPSDFDKKRDTHVGPTNFNTNRRTPIRTIPQKGEEYGHPTKFDYNYVRRRPGVTAENKTAVLPLPKPNQKQKNLKPSYKRVMRQWYLKNKSKKQRTEKLRYRTQTKRDPQAKKYRQYYREFPERYKRKGISPYDTPAERSKAWRDSQRNKARATGKTLKEVKEERLRQKRKPSRSRSPKPPGRKVYAELDRLLERMANWPQSWNTQLKVTAPPAEGGAPSTGVPRKDTTKQQGESLRAPNLNNKPQVGLKWEIKPKAPGGIPSYTVNNPGSGSGKVIPMFGDFVNNTQAIPTDVPDRYLRNNNYDVKTATTLSQIINRVDPKIKMRAAELTPVLDRVNPKNWTWFWKVRDYTIRVQAFKKGNAKNIPKLNLKVSCSCPYWRWWGPEHWSKKDNYLRGDPRGTATFPKIRDPRHWRPICKHVYAVLLKSKGLFVRTEKHPLKKLSSDLTEGMIQRVAQRYLERKE